MSAAPNKPTQMICRNNKGHDTTLTVTTVNGASTTAVASSEKPMAAKMPEVAKMPEAAKIPEAAAEMPKAASEISVAAAEMPKAASEISVEEVPVPAPAPTSTTIIEKTIDDADAVANSILSGAMKLTKNSPKSNRHMVLSARNRLTAEVQKLIRICRESDKKKALAPVKTILNTIKSTVSIPNSIDTASDKEIQDTIDTANTLKRAAAAMRTAILTLGGRRKRRGKTCGKTCGKTRVKRSKTHKKHENRSKTHKKHRKHLFRISRKK